MSADQPFIGEIYMFAGNFAPLGWAFCDGSLQSIADNNALFALLGTTYGGDGQTTFALPDLRSRIPIHNGDGHVDGALSLAAKAHWEGEIHARAAVIAGRISGKLVVEEKVEIGASAVLHADIVARSIAVAKGAVIDGDVTVTSGQPVVQFEERRGTS